MNSKAQNILPLARCCISLILMVEYVSKAGNIGGAGIVDEWAQIY